MRTARALLSKLALLLALGCGSTDDTGCEEPRLSSDDDAVVAPSTEAPAAADERPTAPDSAEPTSHAIHIGRGGLLVAETDARAYEDEPGSSPRYWRPRAADAEALEAALPAYLEAHQGHLQSVSRPLGEYYRHYVGIEQEGRRVLYMFAFCDAHDGDWERPLHVSDGGDCYFHVWFDPETQTVLRHQVHGES